MKAAPFDYIAPTSIEEACALLAEADGGATLLAGGQTLMPLLALRMSQPFILIDINRIAALGGIAKIDDGMRIGPITRQNELIANAELAERLPALVTATEHVGHHQTRNRGTIGGSISFGEPAAELPATAVALGATVVAKSVRGSRRIAARDLYLGPYATALEPDELVTDIVFPDWPIGTVALFREVTRRPGDFALVGLVGALALKGGRVVRAGLAWFGMGSTPIAARQAEEALVGQEAADIVSDEISELALADAEPFDDHHASARYRTIVGRRIFNRALREALGRNAAL